jgi:hypothetical protein
MSKRKRKKAEWAREQTKEVVGFDVRELMDADSKTSRGPESAVSSVWSRDLTKEVADFDAGGFMEKSSAFEREATREVAKPDWAKDVWQFADDEEDDASFFSEAVACA